MRQNIFTLLIWNRLFAEVKKEPKKRPLFEYVYLLSCMTKLARIFSYVFQPKILLKHLYGFLNLRVKKKNCLGHKVHGISKIKVKFSSMIQDSNLQLLNVSQLIQSQKLKLISDVTKREIRKGKNSLIHGLFFDLLDDKLCPFVLRKS